MASNHVSHVDARGSNFVNIGRDHNVHINIILPSNHFRGSLDVISHPNPNVGISTQSNVVTQTHLSGTGSGDFAGTLVIKIMQLLIDHGEIDTDLRVLKLQLQLLHQTLILTDIAIWTYEYTPLGVNLSNCIIPEMEHICVALQQLLDKIYDYRQGLSPTSICDLWRRVWWRGCDVDRGIALLRAKLAGHQKLLGEFLMALNS